VTTDSTTRLTGEALHGVSRGEFIAMMSLITATIAISIDTVLPAFDEIEDEFGLEATNSNISLTITVFLAAMGIGMLAWGPLADRFGRKRTMYASLVLFISGAIVATLANSFGLFLIGRALWGAAAAGPRTVSLAITRDAYDGDLMSRIMSLTTAVFLVVPILAPALGEGLLAIGSWRLTTAAGAAMAVIAAVWFGRLNETLAPENVMPLQIGRIGHAARTVVSNRHTVGFTVASTMAYGAFFPWLGSSTQMIGTIFDREAQFALFFGLNAVFMAVLILISERLVNRFGTQPVLLPATALTVVAGLGYTVVALAADGVPNFWTWFALASILTALNSASTPLMQTRAMEPMGDIAGTASSVTGAIIFIGGALLGSIIDRFITDTVTPFGVGFAIYTGIALVAIVGATARRR